MGKAAREEPATGTPPGVIAPEMALPGLHPGQSSGHWPCSPAPLLTSAVALASVLSAPKLPPAWPRDGHSKRPASLKSCHGSLFPKNALAWHPSSSGCGPASHLFPCPTLVPGHTELRSQFPALSSVRPTAFCTSLLFHPPLIFLWPVHAHH